MMPWYHGWNILAVGMLFQAITFGVGIYCFTFWVAPWSLEFGVGRGDVMMVFLTMQVSMGALAPFAGQAMDRLSIRVLICCGAACMAVGLVLSAMATALWQLVVLYGTLMCAGMLLAGPLAAQTLTARWFLRRRGLALGISTVGTSLGGLTLPPLLTSMQASMGWRDASLVLAIIVAVSVLPLVWWVIRGSPQEAGLADADELKPIASASGFGPLASTSWTVAMVLREPAFWFMVVAFTLLVTAFGGAQQNLAPFALDQGIGASETAWLVSLMALTMAVVKVFFGGLADRIDVRWLFMLAVGSLLVALTWMTTDPQYGEMAFICILLGIAAGAHLPLLATLVSHRFGVASFGRVMGLVGPFTTFGALGPWFAGYVRDDTGSYALAWLVLAGLLLPALISMSRLKPVAGNDLTPQPIQRKEVNT